MPFPFDNEQTIGILSNATARRGRRGLPIIPKQEKQWDPDLKELEEFIGPTFNDADKHVSKLTLGGSGGVWTPTWGDFTILGGGLGPGIKGVGEIEYDYHPPFPEPDDINPYDFLPDTIGGGRGRVPDYPDGDHQVERKSFKNKTRDDLIKIIDPNDPCHENNRARFAPSKSSIENLDEKYYALRSLTNTRPPNVSKEEWDNERVLALDNLKNLIGTLNQFAGFGFDIFLNQIDTEKKYNPYQQLIISEMIYQAYLFERVLMALKNGARHKTYFDYKRNMFTYPCPEDELIEDQLLDQLRHVAEQYNVLSRSLEETTGGRGIFR